MKVTPLALLALLALALALEPHPAPTSSASAPWVLYLEAEQGDVAAPLRRVDDVLTSGCAYLYAAGHNSGAVTLSFTVPADGPYYPWARVMGTSLTNNSFYFSVDGGPPAKYEFPPFHGVWTWGWDRVHLDKTPHSTPITLTAGLHTLTFGGREPGARLDAVLLTDDPAYLPMGIETCPLSPSATPTPAGTPTPTATPDPNATPTPFLWQMEAEAGVVVSPLVGGHDPLASACEYVYATRRVTGSVTLTFTVPAPGSYYPWARAMGSSLWNNSFLFSVDGSPPAWFEIPAEYGEWTWVWRRLLIDPEQPYTTPLTLAAGAHTIVFGGREPGSRLDAVVITDDPGYNPMYRPGGSFPCLLTPSPTRAPSPAAPGPTATPPGDGLPHRRHLPATAADA